MSIKRTQTEWSRHWTLNCKMIYFLFYFILQHVFLKWLIKLGLKFCAVSSTLRVIMLIIQSRTYIELIKSNLNTPCSLHLSNCPDHVSVIQTELNVACTNSARPLPDRKKWTENFQPPHHATRPVQRSPKSAWLSRFNACAVFVMLFVDLKLNSTKNWQTWLSNCKWSQNFMLNRRLI